MLFRSILQQYHRLQVQIEEKEKQIAGETEEAGKQEKRKRELEELFADGYREAGFASLQEYEEALRPAGEIEKKERQIREYYARAQMIEGQIVALEEETKGRKKEDTASLKARQKEKTAGRQRTLELINAKNHSLQEARKIRKSLQEKEKKRKVLEREYGIVKDLDNMASEIGRASCRERV